MFPLPRKEAASVTILPLSTTFLGHATPEKEHLFMVFFFSFRLNLWTHALLSKGMDNTFSHVNTQKYKHLQFLLRKKAKYRFAAIHEFIFITMFQKLLKLHVSRACWSSFDVPAFGKQHVEVQGYSLKSCTAILVQQAGFLPPYPQPILPAWRNPSLRTSLNMPLSYRSADTTLSWRNITLRILTAHCMASPPTRNKRCSACWVLYPWAAIRINWGIGALLPCQPKLHLI